MLALIVYLTTNIPLQYARVVTKCYIDHEGVSVEEGVHVFPWPLSRTKMMANASNMFYGLVEWTTVLLYWYKVRSLKKRKNCDNIPKNKDGDGAPSISKSMSVDVRDRIQSILDRVLILTYFYLFLSFLLFGLDDIAGYLDWPPLFEMWPTSVISLSLCYSMFLMQDHNTSEYIAFLRFIRRWKCVLCFCCFGSMVNEQYRMLVENVDERIHKQMTSGTWNTRNISADIVYGNDTNGMELSLPTKTICDIPKSTSKASPLSMNERRTHRSTTTTHVSGESSVFKIDLSLIPITPNPNT